MGATVLLSNFMSRNFGKINSPDTYRKATEFITKYNEKNKGLFAKISDKSNVF